MWVDKDGIETPDGFDDDDLDVITGKAQSQYWGEQMEADYARLLGRTSEAAHAMVNESERKRLVQYGWLPLVSVGGAPIQLGLFG